MSLIHAIILGIVQGLTEFLPISSTAHLRIVPALLGWSDPGTAFTAVIQLGTMAAVVLYFWQDIWRIAKAFLRNLIGRADDIERGDARIGWFLILGTIPISIFGILFKDQIKSGGRDLYLIGFALIVFGAILGGVDMYAKRERKIDTLDRDDAAFIGFAQALALIPGVSRSGSTITAGLLRGFTRADAARFSFLLSIPAVVLSGLYELKDAVHESTGTGTVSLVVATLAAFVVGYWSIAFLLKWLGEHTMAVFVAYRIALGTLVIALVASGAIH